MKNLILLSNSDRESIPRILLSRNLYLRTDKAILTTLLNSEYDNIIITSNYAKNFGYDSIIKAYQLALAITSSKIIYLSTESTLSNDNIVNWMHSIGINNAYTINWKTITIEEFDGIVSQNNLTAPINKKENYLSEPELQLLKASLETLTRVEAPGYFDVNKGKLIDLVQSQIRLVNENKNLVKSKIELEDINDYLIENKAISDIIIKNQNLKVENLKKEFNELREDVLKNQTAINEYNDLVKNNKVVLQPKLKLNTLAPTVLYFKEYEDIGFYNFFESIVYLLSEVNKIYTKTVIVERSSRNFYNPYNTNGYITVKDSIPKTDIINNDKFVVYGNPVGVIEELASQENRIEIIIVFDRRGTEDIFIEHNRLVPFYLGSYKNKITTVNIPEQSWISPVEGIWSSISPLLDRRILTEHESIIYQAHTTNHKLCRFIEDLLIKGGE